jgi:Ca-activated chloride channel family protein
MKNILSLIFALVLAANVPHAPAKSLAIFDFKNTSGLPALNYLEQAVPQMLLTDLLAATELTLIERAELKKIIEEHQLTLTGLVDEKTAAKIGKLSGADYVLFGTIFSENQQVRLDARICETQTAQIIIAEKVTGTSEILDLISELANRIAQKLINKRLNPNPTETNPVPPIIGDALLGISVTSDNSFKLLNSAEPGYLLVQIKAARVEAKQARIPLNIALVLDKSGSMSHDYKLENARKAALFLIDQLQPVDFFSLITYDTHVNTLVPIQPITTKDQIRELVQKIEPGSSTNLSGGMLEGYAQVEKNYKTGRVNRVLLLSDGLANTGITDPTALKELASQKNRGGITLSTFGVGNDFNEDLMTNLAEFGGANYYFIANPDEIASIFSNELQGLLTIVAQNLRLVLELNPTCRFLQAFGYPTKISGNQIEIKLNDIFSEEQKTILLKFSVPTNSAGKLRLGDISLCYDDVVRENRRMERKFTPTIEITTDPNLVARNHSAGVADNIALFESTRLLDEAISLVDQRNFEAAQESISRNITYLQKNLTPGASRNLKKQYLNVVQYQAEASQAGSLDTEEVKSIQKQMKYENYLQKKKK